MRFRLASGLILMLLLAGCAFIPFQARRPPTTVVVAPVRFYLLPGLPRIYWLTGVQPEVFFLRGRYYLYQDQTWYRAPHYQGPWEPVPFGQLPEGLEGETPERLKERLPSRAGDHLFRPDRVNLTFASSPSSLASTSISALYATMF